MIFINIQPNNYEDNNLLPFSELEVNNFKCTEVSSGNKLYILINYV